MVKSHFEHDGQGSLTLLTLKGGPSILPRRPLFFGRRIFNAIHSAGKTYLNQSDANPFASLFRSLFAMV